MRVQRIIETKLRGALQPERLEVRNESGNHSVPAGSETHFRVLVVSAAFEGRSRLVRHRSVHDALREELSNGVHALAIDAWTPAEWEERGTASVSPPCRGGAGH